MERRIVAILAADMVGYSRLIELDEKGTLARQKQHMIELIRPCIENHNGTILNHHQLKLVGLKKWRIRNPPFQHEHAPHALLILFNRLENGGFKPLCG